MHKKFKKRYKKDFLMFYTGLGLFLIFLILWVLTFPDESTNIIDEEVDNISFVEIFKNMSVSEQVEHVQKEEKIIMDDVYYSRAIRSNNNHYCERIEDENLKKQCFEEITTYEEIIPDTRSESEISDQVYYSRAMRSKNVNDCDRVVNDDLRNECIAELS